MTQTIDGDWLDDDDVDNVGLYLEHQGLEDEEIDDYFLEHFGVRGMQWGVRKQRRIQKQIGRQQKRVDQFRRVASGRGTGLDKLSVGLKVPLGQTLLEGGVTGAAQAELRRAQRFQKDIKAGRRKARAILIKMQGVHYNELNFKFRPA